MKILYIAMDWFWIKARPQQLAITLSEEHQIDYYCLRGWRNAQQNNYSDHIETIGNELFYNKNLRIIRKRYLPGQSKAIVQGLNNLLFIHRELMGLQKANQYDCVFITAPPQMTYLPNKMKQNLPIYYDCMDDYSEFFPKQSDRARILHYESELVTTAKTVFTSSDYLKELMMKRNSITADKLVVVQNGVETDDFQAVQVKDRAEVIPEAKDYKGVIGYVGTIGSWFDIDSVREAAQQLPDYLFYMAGPEEVHYEDVPVNIKFVGPVPYAKVPELMASFDVATMPFIVTELIKAVNPVKIYEYLAAGTPVVAVDYPETQRFESMITRYNHSNIKDFASQLKNVLADESQDVASRKAYAVENDWRHRAAQMSAILEKA